MQHPPQFTGFAPGKIILSGEHSVVYGHPAVVMATKIGSTVTVWEDEAITQQSISQPPELSTEVVTRFISKIKEIFAPRSSASLDHLLFSLQTELPIQSGMGSSASFAAASLRALAKWAKIRLSDEELFTLVQESEKDIHGNPSGVDAAAIIYGGILLFQKYSTGIEYQQIEEGRIPDFYLINSGKPTETTKEMVEYVAGQVSDNKKTSPLLEEIGEVTEQIIAAIEKSDQNALFLLIEKNQRLLENLGVVSDKTKKIIQAVEKVGGFAKVTGAGGREDGSGMILAFHHQPEVLQEFCQEQHLQYLATGIGQRGIS